MDRYALVRHNFISLDVWVVVRFNDIQQGDVFALYERNGDPVENSEGGFINIALADASRDYIQALPA
jgi:hypothetical protein